MGSLRQKDNLDARQHESELSLGEHRAASTGIKAFRAPPLQADELSNAFRLALLDQEYLVEEHRTSEQHVNAVEILVTSTAGAREVDIKFVTAPFRPE